MLKRVPEGDDVKGLSLAGKIFRQAEVDAASRLIVEKFSKLCVGFNTPGIMPPVKAVHHKTSTAATNV